MDTDEPCGISRSFPSRPRRSRGRWTRSSSSRSGSPLLHGPDLLPDPDLRDQVPPRLEGRPLERGRRDNTCWRSLWIGVPAAARAGHVRLGDGGLLRDVPAARATPPRSTWWASSGCGSCSTPRGKREINELHVPGRPAGQADDDLAGRDPQLLRPGVPHEAGRAAGPLHLALVRADASRDAITCSAPSTAARSTRG